MAKVTAPLGSFNASGKIGKALVFFGHLGRNVVRGLVTPANPQTEGQGDNRLMLGALGRSAKAVVRFSDWYVDAKPLVPAGQTWVSQFITNAIQIFGSGNTGVDALKTALSTHDKAAIWESAGASVGLTTVTIPYAKTGDTALTAGAQLYALAAHTMSLKASNPSSFNRAPYTTVLASWSTANINAFASDLQTIS